jgi:endonuclease/exonuclease/phosphatase family metal-dependent hydrolase
LRARRVIKRVLLALLAVVAIFLGYRFATAYTWRGGSCTSTPAALSSAPVPDLSIMSYNIQGHAALLDRDHMSDIAEVIVQEQPDIVGLQEVHVRTWQARRSDQLQQLETLTGMRSAFGPALRSLGGAYGNALLTRGEILQTQVYDLPSFGEPRSLLRATIRIHGSEIDVFVAHLAAWGPLNRRVRRQQAACLAAIVGSTPRPYVLVGDLNATPGNEELSVLLRGTPLTPSGDMQAATHKVTGQRLDFILTDPRWTTVSARVLDVDPADHKPLVSTLRRGG